MIQKYSRTQQINNYFSLIAISLLCLLCFTNPLLASDEKLLTADEAYRISGESLTPDLVQITWDVADKYYLYKDKIKFSTDTPGVTLGAPILPKGKFKHDEFFGEMEIYRGQVHVSIPLIFETINPPSNIQILAKSQGCADRGVCYPPHKQSLNIELMSFDEVAASPIPQQEGGGFFSALSQKLGLGKKDEPQNDFLPEDKVFIPSFNVKNGYIEARWTILDGYYLYRDKFGFNVVSGDGIELGEPVSPPGKKKVDEAFGDIEAYYNDVIIKVPYTQSNTTASDIQLEVKYQGCAEAGFCYPPITKTFPLTIPVFDTAAPAVITAAASTSVGEEEFVTEQDRFAQSLEKESLVWIMLIFFGVGLLLAFTPCVFPMIPILSSIIVGQGPETSTRQAFMLSLAYVLAMAMTYTVVGVIAGLSGANLQAAFQNPWVLTTFSLVFVALAMSMFGFYELQLPSSLQSKLTQISNNQKGGTLIGAAIMGLLSALIVGPCVAAPLAGALIYISQTGDAMLGGLALFSLSMGMGVPLLLIGTSAGKFLPKAGAWMNATKAVFGVMLLAVAIWMLERILPGAVTMFLWAVLAIVSAVYLGALRRLPPEADGWQKLWQGSGLVLLAYGVLILIGAASGGNDPLQPLGKLSLSQTSNSAVAANQKLDFKYIKGVDELNQEIQRANQQGKPVMLDFYADWCVSCKEMEKYTFSDGNVQAALSNFVLLKSDVTENDDLDKELMKHFGIFGPPAIMFFNTQGAERDRYRVVGFMKADAFHAHIKKAIPNT